MRIITIIAALALLLIAPACWLGHVPVAVQSVAVLLDQIDQQTAKLCDEGWLPPKVCDYWAQLKTYASDKWSEYKAEVIDYLIDLLSGALLVASAERPAMAYMVDTSGILAAARAAEADGQLTPLELAKIELACP